MIDQPGLRLTGLDEPDPEGDAADAVAADPVAAAQGVATPTVEVAVDAVGGGGARTWTYAVPAHLADIEPGEAVLVPYGRRQALGVVLGPGAPSGDVTPRPLADRVRADGPLLPPLALALARWIAEHYLAPPALVIRAMLPPAMLERLELVAERRPKPDDGGGERGAGATDPGDGDDGDPADRGDDGGGADDAAAGQPLDRWDADLLEQLAAGPRAVRNLASPDGRAGLVRRLRALETTGAVTLDWTLLAAGVGPRFERWILPTAEGRAAAATLAAGERPPGRPLGPRQVAALLAIEAGPPNGLRAPELTASHGSAAVAGLVRRGLAASETRERPRRPLASRPAGARGGRPTGASLTTAQAEAVAAIGSALDRRDPTPLLLDGVTGGGKTAVYVEAIAASLARGRPALVLVPEIALALPLVDRLRSDLAARVALVHSGLGDGERADEWRRIRAGEVDIVAGTRLAALSPLADVGVVIVDEEHDPAYKSDRTPRIQARDVAVRLAEVAGGAAVLGSATPAVDTVGQIGEGRWRRIVLPSRPSGARPEIELVDLREELQAGNRGLLSGRLAEALSGLDSDQGEQAILVINRRGTASVVMCRDCGTVQACPDCLRPLVFHQAGMTLRCHHCGRATPLATRCPTCQSPRIRYLGGGTERVEREVRERFPRLAVGRLDRDVVERRGAAARVIDDFSEGRLDVLVGTGLVTKGLDIPGVTLVGVVSADIALNLPDERAAERTYQLLAQAVGRAGRGERPGRAVLQTYQPEHPAIRAVVDADPASFYEPELELRRRFRSPPFGRLVKLTVALAERGDAETAAHAMADRLRARAAERDADVTVVGPAPAYVARRGDRWRWNVVLRGTEPSSILDGGLEPPWSVDVDPESLM